MLPLPGGAPGPCLADQLGELTVIAFLIITYKWSASISCLEFQMLLHISYVMRFKNSLYNREEKAVNSGVTVDYVQQTLLNQPVL